MYNSPWVTVDYAYGVIMVATYVVFSVVVTIGGMMDLVYMFRELKNAVVDETDDGRVIKK